MLVESSGNPNAINPSGASGLLQILPSTGHEVGVSQLFDPDQNLKGGTLYLSRLVAQVQLLGRGEITPKDSFKMAVAGYNCGLGYIREAIRMVRAVGKDPTFEEVLATLPGALVHGRHADYNAVGQYVARIWGLIDPAEVADWPL